jgi:hypothetical protein
MDYTILANLLWDLATGVSVGLLVYGAWLCLEYRYATDEIEETKPDAVRMHVMFN